MVSNVFDAMGMGCCLLRRWRLVAELGRWWPATGKLCVNGDGLAGFLGLSRRIPCQVDFDVDWDFHCGHRHLLTYSRGYLYCGGSTSTSHTSRHSGFIERLATSTIVVSHLVTNRVMVYLLDVEIHLTGHTNGLKGVHTI